MKKTGKNLKCKVCNKEFYASGWEIKRGRKLCSFNCHTENKKGKKFTKEHRKKMSLASKGKLKTNGTVLRPDGYKLIFTPDHPNCDSRGYVREHRLVMEKKLGRYLTKKEVVHHIDGNTLNNNINNLKLFSSQSKHIEFHGELNFKR